jgi:AcrR family transcriptional regulator
VIDEAKVERVTTDGASDAGAFPAQVSSTRRVILETAQRAISEHGIDGVSIRSVAREAGVDPRLVRHYFGSKERLLLHAVQIADDPLQLAQRVAAGSPRTVGRRTARVLLEHWDNPRISAPYKARLAASLTNEEVAELMRDDFVTAFFGGLAKIYSPDRHELRAALAAAEVVGLALCRYLVEEPVLQDAEREDLVRYLGRTIQHYLTADLEGVD